MEASSTSNGPSSVDRMDAGLADTRVRQSRTHVLAQCYDLPFPSTNVTPDKRCSVDVAGGAGFLDTSRLLVSYRLPTGWGRHQYFTGAG